MNIFASFTASHMFWEFLGKIKIFEQCQVQLCFLWNYRYLFLPLSNFISPMIGKTFKTKDFLDIQGLNLRSLTLNTFFFTLSNPKLPFLHSSHYRDGNKRGWAEKSLWRATSNISSFLFLVSQKKRTTTNLHSINPFLSYSLPLPLPFFLV